MKLLDCTGKLNSHDDYIRIINKLHQICTHIEIVVLDQRHSNKLVNKLKSDVIYKKEVSKWWGTEILGRKNNLYGIKASDELFNLLKQYETFCKSATLDDKGEFWCKLTDFGYDDIAFYDDNINIPLLYTTTHEGYITIRNDLVK